MIANNAQIYQGGAQVLHNIRGVVGTPDVLGGHPVVLRPLQGRHRDDRRFAPGDGRGLPDGRRSRARRTARTSRGCSRSSSIEAARCRCRAPGATTRPAKQVQVTLEQTQTTGLYPDADRNSRHDDRRRLRSGGGAAPAAARVTHVAQLTQQRQTFSFPAAAEPANVELDPEAWVMMRASFVKK